MLPICPYYHNASTWLVWVNMQLRRKPLDWKTFSIRAVLKLKIPIKDLTLASAQLKIFKLQKKNNEEPMKQGNKTNGLEVPEKVEAEPNSMEDSLLKQIIGPLIDEVKLLRESFHNDLVRMESKIENAIVMQQKDFVDLKDMIVTEKMEFTESLSTKIEANSTNINQLLEENRRLQQENSDLRERISKIEMVQLNNNIIINGMPEQPWEPYEVTKERITEVIASSMGSKDDLITKEEAKKVEITCCSRLGTYKLGKPRPILVTFKQKDDKEQLMTAKKNLPPGIYINHKYPAHIK